MNIKYYYFLMYNYYMIRAADIKKFLPELYCRVLSSSAAVDDIRAKTNISPTTKMVTK